MPCTPLSRLRLLQHRLGSLLRPRTCTTSTGRSTGSELYSRAGVPGTAGPLRKDALSCRDSGCASCSGAEVPASFAGMGVRHVSACLTALEMGSDLLSL